jgi:hypothetical protein
MQRSVLVLASMRGCCATVALLAAAAEACRTAVNSSHDSQQQLQEQLVVDMLNLSSARVGVPVCLPQLTLIEGEPVYWPSGFRFVSACDTKERKPAGHTSIYCQCDEHGAGYIRGPGWPSSCVCLSAAGCRRAQAVPHSAWLGQQHALQVRAGRLVSIGSPSRLQCLFALLLHATQHQEWLAGGLLIW